MMDRLLEKAAERIGTLTVENDLLRIEGEALLARVQELERTLAVRINAELEAERQRQVEEAARLAGQAQNTASSRKKE